MSRNTELKTKTKNYMLRAQNGNAFKALNKSIFFMLSEVLLSVKLLFLIYGCILKNLTDANYEKQNVVQIRFWSFYLCV